MRSSQKTNCEGVRNCAKASSAAQSRSCAPPFRVRQLRTARREAIYKGFRSPVLDGVKPDCAVREVRAVLRSQCPGSTPVGASHD